MSQLLFPARRVLWMDAGDPAQAFSDPLVPRCCDEMRAALTHVCDQHADPFDCPDMVLCYSPQFDEYGLILHDGGASYLVLSSCPFCGAALPKSRRDAWFDALEALGIEEPFAEDAALPEAYTSARWWQTAKET